MSRAPSVLAAVVLAAAPAGVRADNASGTVRPGAVVRVVGERFIVVTRADATGWYHVGNLPPAHYRIEVDGVPLPPPPEPPHAHAVTITREWMCVIQPPRRSFATVLGAAVGSGPPRPAPVPLVDTRSTAQGVTIASPGW